MKQKSYKQLKINEIFYNKKHNIELNNKLKRPRLKNAKSAINYENIICKSTNEMPGKNNIKNIPFKTKLIKIISSNERNKRYELNKIKSYKDKIYDKTEISQEIKNKQNNILKGEAYTNIVDNQNKDCIEDYNEINDENLDNNRINQSMTPIKNFKNEGKIKNIKQENILKQNSRMKLSNKNENKIYNFGNKTVNEFDYKKMENNIFNLKNKKGTFSLNNFFRKKNNNDKEINEKDNQFESERNYFNNRFKDKIRNNSIKKKEELTTENNDNLVNNTVKDFKNKNIILLNFRSDKRKRFYRENRISTSSEKENSKKNGALKILEFLKNKTSEKIIIKQNEKKEERENIGKNVEENKKEEEKNINIKNNNKCTVNNDIEINNNKEKILNMKKEDKDNPNNKSIFNEIIEEVKQEKNYIQKIVYRKIIQGIKELKQDNSFHHRKYNSNSFQDISLKTHGNQYSDVNNILDENNKNKDNLININIDSNLLSDKKEKNRYLKINLDSFKYHKNYEKYKTYDNRNNNNKSNDNIIIDFNNENIKNENNKMKIKKIKLDKLKNKLKKNTLNYYKGDKININLNLNNKIINIHNNQKIYMPKKVSITKRSSVEMMSIPLFYSHSPDYKNNSLTPSIYSKSEEINNLPYITNIKPFKEITIFNLGNEKNRNNNIIDKNNNNNINTIINFNKNIKNININTNNVNNKEKVKHILYSKAKIKRINENENENLTENRCKTIRYIKKSKNKIERIENKKRQDTNKIIRIQEMQFDGIPKKYSEKTINNLDQTEPINFNLNSPFMKQNSFIKYRTYLSSEINDMPNFNFKENKKSNETNLSYFYSNNGDDHDETFSTQKFNTGTTTKLGYNCSYDRIINNITGTDDIFNENNAIKLEQIFNLLSFEDLLIIEDKFNLILIVLEKGNKTYEEYFDLWNFFFFSSLKSKLEQVFKYFLKETENMKSFINYSLVFFMICYDFAANSISVDIDNNFSLIEIAQVIYTNLLIVINLIKSKITFDNKDNYNIRLIELSKIEFTIKNKLSNIDNDYLFIKEILHNNANLIIKKISSIIESNIINNISNKKYNSEIFSKIKNISFEEINKFFLENILKENFIGCSVLASTYLKEKHNLVPGLAPYISFKNKKKYSLILDLDETLIHFKVNHDESEEGVLKLRPGVFTFLEKVKEYYEIILFTEASEAYAKLIMEAFNNNQNKKQYFEYKLYRQHAIIIEQDFVKDLSRVGRPLDKTIIIDNIGQNFKMQKSNGILIKPFLGEDQNDQALIDLIPILINIARDEIDVRNGLMKYRDEILTKISSNLFRRNKKK